VDNMGASLSWVRVHFPARTPAAIGRRGYPTRFLSRPDGGFQLAHDLLERDSAHLGRVRVSLPQLLKFLLGGACWQRGEKGSPL
jgi:hypothetical protein